MAQIYSYNKERNDTNSDVYLKSILIGGFLAFLFIGLGLGVKFIVLQLIKYWIWVVGFIALLIAFKIFNDRRKRKMEDSRRLQQALAYQ